jgi:hypothetical protein
MHGFRTARALVLDNTPAEALPVIRALGSLGIGALYHDASPDAEYSEKIGGIRLMFLDMVLENRSATPDDPANCVSILIGALEQLLEKTSEPVLIVCWTKHSELKEEFEKAFRATFADATILQVLLFEKDKLVEHLPELVAAIKEALSHYTAVSILLGWEQMVHDAASRTTSAITHIVSEYNEDPAQWNALALQVCAALCLAERGTRLLKESEIASLQSFYRALNPLLLDRLEYSPLILDWLPENVAQLLRTAVDSEKIELDKKKRNSLLPVGVRGALNSMVHLSYQVIEGEVSPGNLYFMNEPSENRKSWNAGLPAVDWKAVIENTFGAPNPTEAQVVPSRTSSFDVSASPSSSTAVSGTAVRFIPIRRSGSRRVRWRMPPLPRSVDGPAAPSGRRRWPGTSLATGS